MILRPCPHCGEDASVNNTQHMEGILKPPIEDGIYYVRCMAGCLHLRHTKYDAITAWNRRNYNPDKSNKLMENVVKAAKAYYEYRILNPIHVGTDARLVLFNALAALHDYENNQ